MPNEEKSLGIRFAMAIRRKCLYINNLRQIRRGDGGMGGFFVLGKIGGKNHKNAGWYKHNRDTLQ